MCLMRYNLFVKRYVRLLIQSSHRFVMVISKGKKKAGNGIEKEKNQVDGGGGNFKEEQW